MKSSCDADNIEHKYDGVLVIIFKKNSLKMVKLQNFCWHFNPLAIFNCKFTKKMDFNRANSDAESIVNV